MAVVQITRIKVATYASGGTQQVSTTAFSMTEVERWQYSVIKAMSRKLCRAILTADVRKVKKVV